VTDEAELVGEAVTLQIAAVELGFPPPAIADQSKAVRGLAAVQRELLLVGWDALLTGRYAAAVQPVRILDELSVFIMAVAVSQQQAALVLTKPGEEWKINKAHGAIKADAGRRGDSPGYEAWAEHRAAVRKDLHQFAHTSGSLLLQALRFKGSYFGVPLGPDLDEEMLRRVARYYVLLAQEMVFAVGYAAQDHLPDDGPWSARQRRLNTQVQERHEAWRQDLAGC
jgi:hypothetical protein